MSRELVKEQFTEIVNIIQPAHPYFDPYPVQKETIEFGYKKSSSSYYASCGPQKNPRKPVFFKFETDFFEKIPPSRVVAVFLHELTHIKIGLHSSEQVGSHPPRFWKEYGFYTHIALDNLDEFINIVGFFTPKELIGKIVSQEINKFNIDKRYTSVRKQQQEMARWFNSTLR